MKKVIFPRMIMMPKRNLDEGSIRLHSKAACPRGGLNWQPDSDRALRLLSTSACLSGSTIGNQMRRGVRGAWRFWLPIAATIEASSKACRFAF